MIASDNPNFCFVSDSMTASWLRVLDAVKEAMIKEKLDYNRLDFAMNGADYFGISNPEVLMCIEGLEGARECKDYICWKVRQQSLPEVNAVKRDNPYVNNVYNDKRQN